MAMQLCPFCGGESMATADREPFGIGAYHAVAACLNDDECGASIHAVESSRDEARVAVIARWNRRTQPTGTKGETPPKEGT